MFSRSRGRPSIPGPAEPSGATAPASCARALDPRSVRRAKAANISRGEGSVRGRTRCPVPRLNRTTWYGIPPSRGPLAEGSPDGGRALPPLTPVGGGPNKGREYIEGGGSGGAGSLYVRAALAATRSINWSARPAWCASTGYISTMNWISNGTGQKIAQSYSGSAYLIPTVCSGFRPVPAVSSALPAWSAETDLAAPLLTECTNQWCSLSR